MANDFVNPEKMKELVERLADVARPLGLTVIGEMTGFSVAGEDVVLVAGFLVRESASQEIDQSKADREAFSKMLAENHEAKLREDTERIAKHAQNPDTLAELLFGDGADDDECSHENLHPEGFCLDCGKGLDDE